MKSRRIAVATILSMAACVFLLSVVLASGRGRGWALPAYLAVVAVVLTVGLVAALRAERGRTRGR